MCCLVVPVTWAARSLIIVSRSEVDYTDFATLRRFLREMKPEYLINAAGYTGKPNVDACEYNRDACILGNVLLPQVIRLACTETQTRWGHVSSGCIYTGQRPDGSGFREDDPPNFCFETGDCSFYSGTKALGEAVLQDAPECYVWRLRIPFSHVDSPRNYLSKVLRYERLLDATNSLSHLGEFVRAAVQCFEQNVACGVYNLTNTGAVSTREVVELLRESGLAEGRSFQFFESEAEFMQLAAKTPRSNCVLDNSKALQAGLKLSPVRDAVRQALSEWVSDQTSGETA